MQSDERRQYTVKATRPLSGIMATDREFSGKGTMEINPSWFSLTINPFSRRKRDVSGEWGRVRELIDNLQKDQSFRANFGNQKENIVLRIKIVSGDISSLQLILADLPETARAIKCPACGGPILTDTCSQCGENPGGYNRRLGKRLTVVGIALLFIAMVIGFVVLHWEPSNLSALYFLCLFILGSVYKMAILVGIGLILWGIYKLLTGK